MSESMNIPSNNILYVKDKFNLICDKFICFAYSPLCDDLWLYKYIFILAMATKWIYLYTGIIDKLYL